MAEDAKGIGQEEERTGNLIVQNWFDQLELTLRSEASLAGLLEHGTLIGSAREFFATRMLKSILPPTVHIGTGRVIGGKGVSKQVDIVLYDPRCPLLEVQPGVGMYFVEGVIATMEIKSKLNHGKLKDALDNCKSVTDVGVAVRSREALDRRAAALIQRKKLPPKCAEDAVKWSLTPRTYIFSFSTDMTTQSIMDATNEWYGANGQCRTSFFPSLPAVIATQGTIGLMNDDWFMIDPGEDIREVMRNEQGEDARVVMGIWETQRQFGWLALRLLHDVNDRLGLPHEAMGAKLAIDSYLPAMDYFNEDCEGTLGRFIVWDRKTHEAAHGACG